MFTCFFIALDCVTHYKHNINSNWGAEISSLFNHKISLINLVNQESFILIVKNLKGV